MRELQEVKIARATLDAPKGGSALEVVALFTTESEAASALRSAATLASGLSARIRLLAPHVVPYVLPVDKPAINLDFFSQRLCAIAERAGVDCEIDIRVCRDRMTAIGQALPGRAIVVIGQRPRWWRFSTRRLSQQLSDRGHQVVFVERERLDA